LPSPPLRKVPAFGSSTPNRALEARRTTSRMWAATLALIPLVVCLIHHCLPTARWIHMTSNFLSDWWAISVTDIGNQRWSIHNQVRFLPIICLPFFINNFCVTFRTSVRPPPRLAKLTMMVAALPGTRLCAQSGCRAKWRVTLDLQESSTMARRLFANIKKGQKDEPKFYVLKYV
jgi:hypothetical protein